MRGVRADRERLLDIQDALDAIGRHPIASFEEFMADELVRYFAAKHIEMIGEAACKISDELKAKHEEVPWRAVEKTRQVLGHDYFRINWQTVWEILKTRTEPLRFQIATILSELDIHD
jgi:uncharacterized protein with HEPN domain